MLIIATLLPFLVSLLLYVWEVEALLIIANRKFKSVGFVKLLQPRAKSMTVLLILVAGVCPCPVLP
jgi:hypothetical protein